jgi:hypothetical protein
MFRNRRTARAKIARDLADGVPTASQQAEDFLRVGSAIALKTLSRCLRVIVTISFPLS